MIKILPIACYKLLLSYLVSIPVWSQAQSLETLILDALATQPSTQSQRAQVASAMAGVGRTLTVIAHAFGVFVVRDHNPV